MKRWIFLLALTLSVPALSLLKGQAILSIVSFTATPDSLVINEVTGDTLIHYEFRIANLGDDYFYGDLPIKAEYVNTEIIEDWWVGHFTGPVFPAHDTITVTIDDPVHSYTAKYDGGGNVIVIWPSAVEAIVLDSGTTDVYIEGIIGVTPPDGELEGRITPFPNPATGVLNLDWGKDQNLLESVSIIDAAGREWRKFSEIVPSIDLTEMPPGVYFLRVQYTDGVKGVYKMVYINR